jgi:hypothetical protein
MVLERRDVAVHVRHAGEIASWITGTFRDASGRKRIDEGRQPVDDVIAPLHCAVDRGDLLHIILIPFGKANRASRARRAHCHRASIAGGLLVLDEGSRRSRAFRLLSRLACA